MARYTYIHRSRDKTKNYVVYITNIHEHVKHRNGPTTYRHSEVSIF